MEKGTYQKVAVIGAGVMGSAIAAHFANAGCQVLLLDRQVEAPKDPSALALQALKRLKTQKPAPLMRSSFIKRIQSGNLQDDQAALAECDWIIEAIIEDLPAKQAVYDIIETHLSPHTIVSSNTSTIPLSYLISGRSQQFRQNFLITHFFNPPRYMRLLEIVAGDQIQVKHLQNVMHFADRNLGKTCILCHDRPGFIANRLGTFWLLTALQQTQAFHLDLETVDALLGKPFGIPKTGVFGLIDLVGVDLIPLVGQSLAHLLPKTDPYHQVYQCPPIIGKMIADGYTGRKGKGGFYRLDIKDGNKIKQVLNLEDGTYSPVRRPKPECLSLLAGKEEKGHKLRRLISGDSPEQQFMWAVFARTLGYAAALIPEVSTSPADIDSAMRLGYGWQYGPFELIDLLGVAWVCERLEKTHLPVPELLHHARQKGVYQFSKKLSGQASVQRLQIQESGDYADIAKTEAHITFQDLEQGFIPVQKYAGGRLWDLEDGVACLTLENKVNALDLQSLDALDQSLDEVGKNFKALVLHQSGDLRGF